MVGANAAGVYGFDLDALGSGGRPGRAPGRTTSAARSHSSDIPDEALRCPAFALAKAARRLADRPDSPSP